MGDANVLYIYINHTLLVVSKEIDIMQSNRKDVSDTTYRRMIGFYEDEAGAMTPFEIFTDRINDDRDLKEIVMDSLRAQFNVLNGEANKDYRMKYVLNKAVIGGPVEVIIYKEGNKQ